MHLPRPAPLPACRSKRTGGGEQANQVVPAPPRSRSSSPSARRASPAPATNGWGSQPAVS